MKRLLHLSILVCLRLTFAGEVPEMPLAAITVIVQDETGTRLSGVSAGIRAQQSGDEHRRIGRTDANGTITATLPAFGYLDYSAGGGDYYSSWGQISFNPGAVQGKPSEWKGR